MNRNPARPVTLRDAQRARGIHPLRELVSAPRYVAIVARRIAKAAARAEIELLRLESERLSKRR